MLFFATSFVLASFLMLNSSMYFSPDSMVQPSTTGASTLTPRLLLESFELKIPSLAKI
jgi:hypothetical protein